MGSESIAHEAEWAIDSCNVSEIVTNSLALCPTVISLRILSIIKFYKWSLRAFVKLMMLLHTLLGIYIRKVVSFLSKQGQHRHYFH